MNILLIEDERLVAVSLVKLLQQLEPDAVIHGPVESVTDAGAWLKQHQNPDLIISDIQLSDGIALDIFTTGDIACPIIFTTAHNEYAIRAFKLNSIDYLLKPVDKNELLAALKKFHLLQAKFSNPVYLDQLTDLFAGLSATKKFKERFAVHLGRSVTLVSTADIAMFVKEEIIFLVDLEGTRYITDFRSLDEIEALLDPGMFYRVNRQHLMHLPFIESYRGDDTGKLTLKLRGIKTNELVISKEKAADFKKWFD